MDEGQHCFVFQSLEVDLYDAAWCPALVVPGESYLFVWDDFQEFAFVSVSVAIFSANSQVDFGFTGEPFVELTGGSQRLEES